MTRFIMESGFRLFLVGFAIGIAVVTAVSSYDSRKAAELAVHEQVGQPLSL